VKARRQRAHTKPSTAIMTRKRHRGTIVAAALKSQEMKGGGGKSKKKADWSQPLNSIFENKRGLQPTRTGFFGPKK